MDMKNKNKHHGENTHMGHSRTDLRTLAMTVACALFLFCGNAVSIVTAQTGGSGTQTSGQPEQEKNCATEMRVTIAEETKAYRTFMDTNFQNKSSTASLLAAGVQRYEEFMQKLSDKYKKECLVQGLYLQSSESAKIAEASRLIDDAQMEARSLLSRKATTTSSVKQTTALMDKYKIINDKLTVMNKTFMLFKSYMDTFALKVPCYIKDRCNAG